MIPYALHLLRNHILIGGLTVINLIKNNSIIKSIPIIENKDIKILIKIFFIVNLT